MAYRAAQLNGRGRRLLGRPCVLNHDFECVVLFLNDLDQNVQSGNIERANRTAETDLV
jgi:hypothetical protein